MREIYINAVDQLFSVSAVKLIAATSAGAVVVKATVTDDLVVCFAIALLGAFGSMGLAKNARHLLSEALSGVCIGTGAAFVALRSGFGSPIPELSAFLVSIGGLVVPVTIRHNIGKWILELKEKFLPSKPKGPD